MYRFSLYFMAFMIGVIGLLVFFESKSPVTVTNSVNRNSLLNCLPGHEIECNALKSDPSSVLNAIWRTIKLLPLVAFAVIFFMILFNVDPRKKNAIHKQNIAHKGSFVRTSDVIVITRESKIHDGHKTIRVAIFDRDERLSYRKIEKRLIHELCGQKAERSSDLAYDTWIDIDLPVDTVASNIVAQINVDLLKKINFREEEETNGEEFYTLIS